MPELPEVETVVQGLRDSGLQGRRIRSVRVHWPRSVAETTVRTFCARLKGQTIRDIRRRGKYIVVDLSSAGTLLVHLRMTGRLYFKPSGAPREAHEHVRLMLDDGRELRFRDTRKFGRWTLTRTPDVRLGRLGPEPFDPALTGAAFSERLRRHTGALKPLLLNQAFLAGLGNIYVDEALWEAKLHPARRADSLADSDRRRLYRAVRLVLRRGIRSMGTSLGNASTNFYSVAGRRGRNQDMLRVFRRTGRPCPRCTCPIERLVIAQRSSHVCPACQPL